MPDPVGPPTSTSPRGSCASSSTDGGKPSVDSRGTRVGSKSDRRRRAAPLAMQVDRGTGRLPPCGTTRRQSARRDTAAARAARAPAARPPRCRGRRAALRRAGSPCRPHGSPAAHRPRAADRCRRGRPATPSHRSSRALSPLPATGRLHRRVELEDQPLDVVGIGRGYTSDVG